MSLRSFLKSIQRLQFSSITTRSVFVSLNCLGISCTWLGILVVPSIFICIILTCIATISAFLYFFVIYIEPGYIGFPEPDFEDKELCRKLALNYNFELKRKLPVSSDNSNFIETKTSIKRFSDLPRNFCKICNVQQPLRTRHCYTCGQCVLRYEHHCPLIGACIGQNNHGVFWLWLLFQTITLILSLAWLFSVIIILEPSIQQDPSKLTTFVQFQLVYTFIVIIMLFLVSIIVSSVFVFQTYLISTNQITYEYTRVTAIDENSDYERSLESGQLKTWPWYFRALVVGEFICEGEERKILINHRGKVIPFSHGIYKNWIHFAKLSWKGLSLPNRGWQNRWNRSGIVMESFIMENRSKIKFHETNCEPDNHHIQEDGYVSRLFIEEVGNVSISKSLIQQLEKEFGK